MIGQVATNTQTREELLTQVATGLRKLFENKRAESFVNDTFWDQMYPATKVSDAPRLNDEQGGTHE